MSTFTFVLSHNHSSHIHSTAISPPPNPHRVLDVTKSCQNKWEYESSLIFLLIRKLGESGEASKTVTLTGAVTDQPPFQVSIQT